MEVFKFTRREIGWHVFAKFCLCATGLWVAYALAVPYIGFINPPQGRGVFGDMFGALSCLFALLSFAGVLFSMRVDHEDRRQQKHVDSLKALLVSIEHQISAATRIYGDGSTEVGALLSLQWTISTELRNLLLESAPENANPLPDNKIIEIFQKYTNFNTEGLMSGIGGLRDRLTNWRITTPEELESFLSTDAIIKFVSDVYNNELHRPFDPQGLVVWGGMLYRQGNTEEVRQHLLNTLRKSKEWKEKNPAGVP